MINKNENETDEKLDKMIDEMMSKKGTMKEFTDMMLDMLIETGDRKAIAMKKTNETVRALRNLQHEVILKPMTDAIENDDVTIDTEKNIDNFIHFLDDIKHNIEIFYKNVKESNNE